MMLTATEQAQARVGAILENPDYSGKVFRVAIAGGGCSGFKYEFDITEPEDDDIKVGEGIVTDPLSQMYLDGATLEYVDDVFIQAFRVTNPQVKTTCGCGESIGF